LLVLLGRKRDRKKLKTILGQFDVFALVPPLKKNIGRESKATTLPLRINDFAWSVWGCHREQRDD